VAINLVAQWVTAQSRLMFRLLGANHKDRRWLATVSYL